jgi:hypothetical protein
MDPGQKGPELLRVKQDPDPEWIWIQKVRDMHLHVLSDPVGKWLRDPLLDCELPLKLGLGLRRKQDFPFSRKANIMRK